MTDAAPAFRTILVGTDGSERATRAVQQAAELAQRLGASLHIVQAYKGIEDTIGTAMAVEAMPNAAEAMVGAADLDDVAREEARAAGSSLEELAAALRDRGIIVETHAVPGSPSTVILETAAAVGADLVVVGNRGMTGAKRILGSVPNTLSHHAGCAVLIVRTDE